MFKHDKKSTKKDFNKKTKKKDKKPAARPYTGGSWCSTMTRLNKNKNFNPNESW